MNSLMIIDTIYFIDRNHKVQCIGGILISYFYFVIINLGSNYIKVQKN